MLDEFKSSVSLVVFLGSNSLDSDNGVVVKPSRIKGAGLGLFTTRRFEKGDAIATYQGCRHATSSALRLQDKSYLMRLGPQEYVDAKDNLLCRARYINDCRNKFGHNAVFVKHPHLGLAEVVAARVVDAGYEVYADYGPWYWATVPGVALSVRDLVLERLENEK
jgi:hypothetical protein